jgi:hypothetical protein
VIESVNGTRTEAERVLANTTTPEEEPLHETMTVEIAVDIKTETERAIAPLVAASQVAAQARAASDIPDRQTMAGLLVVK